MTSVDGINGRLRFKPEDFIVEEILRNGLVVPVSPVKASKINIPLSGSGKYMRAILIKRNCATLTAIYVLSRHFKIPVNAFSFLGFKDARAVTSQLISISHQGGLNLNFSGKNIKVIGCVNSCAPVKFHELYGNRFTVKIRFIRLPEEDIVSRVKQFLSEVKGMGGIPAYFGYQRFGTIKPISHRVGKALLTRDYELTIRLLIDNYKPSSTRLDRVFLPVNYELLILRYLNRGYRNYFKLVKKIPRLLRILFVNAYQSYIFNRTLSLRIKFGLPLNEAVVGDLVGFPITGSIPRSQVIMVSSRNKSKVNKLIQKGLMSVVLPIIGYNIKLLPRGAALEPFLKALEEDGISIDLNLNSRTLFPAFHGTYRPVLFSVDNFKILDLSLSSDNTYNLMLSFTLRKGFYASILLRELIKPMFPNKNGF